jgi:hypothetical protein
VIDEEIDEEEIAKFLEMWPEAPTFGEESIKSLADEQARNRAINSDRVSA